MENDHTPSITDIREFIPTGINKLAISNVKNTYKYDIK